MHHYTVQAVLHSVVSSVTRAELGKSYHEGCPVVRSTIVDPVEQVWSQALQRRYPIRKTFPTADYGGSDVASMYRDNTSAFNCHVTGDPTKLSPHSYGVALDIDPVENPYQDVHGTWWPRTIGERYRDRSHSYPGMLYSDSVVTQALRNRGFRWGGYWSHADYQHFDTFSDKGGAGPGGGDLGGLAPAPARAPLARRRTTQQAEVRRSSWRSSSPRMPLRRPTSVGRAACCPAVVTVAGRRGRARAPSGCWRRRTSVSDTCRAARPGWSWTCGWAGGWGYCCRARRSLTMVGCWRRSATVWRSVSPGARRTSAAPAD